MCLVCFLQYLGGVMGRTAAGACGARQGEYALTEDDKQEERPACRSRHDWRYYLCCKSSVRADLPSCVSSTKGGADVVTLH
ncbi:hypothetical protein E2C01_099283 [Portunus trituberculatus]|uniref:Uncharacterized protein n=1 Tax=Portunus trituberculatus TaxID=210409 RepID=A0A5B7JZY9_PORTR|nr:hypothetical protein [Portunus trituberculatus]